MSDPVLVEVDARQAGGEPPSRRGRGRRCRWRRRLSAGEVAKPVFPRSAIKALQALPLVEFGAADRYTAERRRARARLRLARRRTGPCRRRRPHAGESRARRIRAAAAAHIGRCRSRRLLRWRDTARPRPCTTIAPASMPAFFVLPARMERGSRQLLAAGASGAARGPRRAGRYDRAPFCRKIAARSMAARCRPGRCRCKILRTPSPNSAPAKAFRPSVPKPPRGCGRPAHKILGTSPAPDDSAPRSCGYWERGLT